MRVVSILNFLLHPILMPLVGILCLFQTGSWLSGMNAEAVVYVYGLTLTCTILLPLATHLVFKPHPRIELMLYAFYVLIAAFILQQINAPVIFPLYLNGLSILILIAALIRIKWAISLHTIAVGSITGLILALSLKWMLDLRGMLMILIVLAGIAGSVRLGLQKNTPAQIASGWFLGFSALFLLIRFI